MDVLCYDTDGGHHVKAVARSPVLTLAEEAAGLPGDLLVTGSEMGGGPISTVLKERAKNNEVVMSESASATVHHNRARVESLGIRIVGDDEAEDLNRRGTCSHMVLRDLDRTRLRGIVEALGVPFSFDVIGVCAQDHGVPPAEVSHLDYRQRLFKTVLDRDPRPSALLYGGDAVPETLNRLCSIAEDARTFPAAAVYVMDSGMAAIQGASMDPHAKAEQSFIVLDVATSHTVGAAMASGEIAGFFEYHTRDVTLPRLESLIRQLAEGRLEHQKILEEGGHGAYIRHAIGLENAGVIVSTGPKRGLLRDTRLPVVQGAPLGDNMMTGTFGLLTAICTREGIGLSAG
jgi:uncharacterized protein (DUF1786 family)